MKKDTEMDSYEKKEQQDTQSQWEADLIYRIDRIEETAGAVQTMTKRDYIVAGVITIVCLVFVVAGAFLN